MKKRITQLMFTMVMMYAMAANATAYDEANWFITIDVEQVRTKVLPLIPKSKEQVVLAQVVPHEVHNITMYGHSEAEDDLSLAVTGQFAGFSFNDHLQDQLLLLEQSDAILLDETESHRGRVIERYRIKEKQGDVGIYVAKVTDSLMVLSLQKAEVRNWIDQKYHMQDLSNNGLVSLLVNVESAMAKMGADLQAHQSPFQSTVFNKIAQFSASIYEAGDQLGLEAAVATADEASAKQMEQVLNGLIAMQALSEMNHDKPVLAALMAELMISNHGNELLITTALPFALLAEIDVD